MKAFVKDEMNGEISKVIDFAASTKIIGQLLKAYGYPDAVHFLFSYSVLNVYFRTMKPNTLSAVQNLIKVHLLMQKDFCL